MVTEELHFERESEKDGKRATRLLIYAIVSLITPFIGLSLVGFVFAVMALSGAKRIRKRAISSSTGKKLTAVDILGIIGLVISILVTIVTAVILTLIIIYVIIQGIAALITLLVSIISAVISLIAGAISAIIALLTPIIGNAIGLIITAIVTAIAEAIITAILEALGLAAVLML